MGYTSLWELAAPFLLDSGLSYRYHYLLALVSLLVNLIDFSSVYPVLFPCYWRGGSGSQRIHVSKTGTFTTHKVRRPKLRR